MDEKPETKPMGQVIQIDEARIRDHLGEMVRGTVEEALNAMLDAEADRWCGAGRDPRPAFVTATFQEGVEKVSDLKPGMLLERTVTNVAAFGAFVDVGVHQDGLVHVSQLADRFVKDPHEVVKAGEVVKVRVLEVDVPRKRISLSMRKDTGDREAQKVETNQRRSTKSGRGPARTTDPLPAETGSFGAALLDAMKPR
jgi:uncharacterized protein